MGCFRGGGSADRGGGAGRPRGGACGLFRCDSADGGLNLAVGINLVGWGAGGQGGSQRDDGARCGDGAAEDTRHGGSFRTKVKD